MRKIYQFLMLVASMTMFSCGSSNSNDEPEPTPSVNIILRSQSINEGAEVDAASTTVLTLDYNTTVRVTGSGITLNGTAVTAKSNAKTAMSVDIPLDLKEAKSYTLKVEKGAIVSTTDANSSAPEFTLNFTTKEGAKPLDNDAVVLAKLLGWGWNLGNHFDTSSGKDGEPNQWGYWDNATPTAALYTNLKAAGVRTVRIPVTWGNYQNPNDPNWTIDAAFMAEVKQNVEWAEAAGLNVILNIHHDEYWTDIKTAAINATKNDEIKDRIEKTWKQIAEAFKDKGDFLFFESFNELQDGKWGWGDNKTDGGKQYNTLNEWNQLVVNTIRATGSKNAKRWIGVPAYASNPIFALENSFKLPTDAANRIMVSVHFYDPSSFTLTPVKDNISDWGHTGKNNITGSNEEHIVEIFQKLQEKFIAKNIPVYIGEYGCVIHTTDRANLFRNYYLEYVCRAAHTYNLPVVLWDNWDAKTKGGGDEHHYYFNHNDGTYYSGAESIVKTMIKAATSNDANYTLKSIYNNAPK
jgi:endoglucanase